MVNRQEKYPDRISRNEVVAALLNFVEKTTRASDAYKQAGLWAEPLAHGTAIALGSRESSFAAAIASGATALNDCLNEVGGLYATWVDKSNGELMQGNIMGCKEFNSETGTWNLVFQSPTYTGLIGATPQRLSEILGQS